MGPQPQLLAWLLVGHLVGDYILQTSWMARNKATLWFPLLVHSLVYSLSIWFFSVPLGGLSFSGLVLVFLAHLFLDRRGFVSWWVRAVCGAGGLPWMAVVVDQSWHAVILALATLV